ncbi:hypothetical protein [Paenibacillus luteus]|nr:hypothetical protein [Paenibacillus luteus]
MSMVVKPITSVKRLYGMQEVSGSILLSTNTLNTNGRDVDFLF